MLQRCPGGRPLHMYSLENYILIINQVVYGIPRKAKKVIHTLERAKELSLLWIEHSTFRWLPHSLYATEVNFSCERVSGLLGNRTRVSYSDALPCFELEHDQRKYDIDRY